MKVVQINAVCGRGSTGKICAAVSKILTDQGIENYILYSLGKSDLSNAVSCAKKYEIKIQALKSKIFGNYGFNSKRQTKRMIKRMNEIKPDIVHIHNIHGHDCHLGMLFDYLREKKIKVFWTFHDCWAFTGYCPHYDMINCGQWRTGCKHCPQRKNFSFFFDRSASLFRKKKSLLSGLDLTIITPSEWLKSQVEQSFLRDYPIKVIHNGINLNVFTPKVVPYDFEFLDANKKIILGVAFDWGKRKGLDIFLRLAVDLDDRYQIVLVGTTPDVDKYLPSNIISVHRTANQEQLAQIYARASVFVNPTREDTFPTTNLEAMACGTPVITFDVGGSKEMLTKHTGIVVAKDNYEGILCAIHQLCEKDAIKSKECREQSEKYEETQRFYEYIALYMGET